MKAKRLLIAEKLLAVALCIAIVFAFVPWAAQSAYAAEATVKAVNFRSINLTLGNEIGMNVYFELSDGVSATTVKATCNGETIDFAMPTKTEKIFVNGTTYDCYKVTVKVVAKMMADDITIQLYNGDASVGEAYKTSVKTYANTLLADPTQEYYRELVSAMLNYGAAVQNQLEHNISNLANTGHELEISTVANNYAVKAENVNLPAGVTANSINVSYKTTTTLTVKLSGVPEGTSITCASKSVKTTGVGDVTVEINGIMASEITKLLTLNVGNGFLKVSVSNYCYLAQNNSSSANAAVAKALHAYGLAAENFLNPQA